MKLATWNVNSIRARTDLIVDWVCRNQPDVLCMQETKVVDDAFPTEEFLRCGYAVCMSGQKTYNGVAIASRLPIEDVTIGLLDEPATADKRCIAATIAGVRIYNVYVPNGKAVSSPSFQVKLGFFERLRRTLDVRERPDRDLVVCGDFNVAAEERDVFDVEIMRGQLHFHPDEHQALNQLFEFGMVDALRLHHPQAGLFSWWDYRAGSFQKNQGLRIDYLLLSQNLARRCSSAHIDIEPRSREKPSDHVPVVVEIS